MGSASAKPEISPIEGNFKVIEEVEPKKEKTLKTSEENVESKDEGNTNEVDGVRPTIQEVDELGDVLEDGTEPRVISEQAFASRRIINAPNVCPPGYRMDPFGKCRKIM